MCVRTDENPEVFVLAGFAARERMREAKPVKLKKVAFSHFFDTLKRRRLKPAALFDMLYFFLNRQ